MDRLGFDDRTLSREAGRSPGPTLRSQPNFPLLRKWWRSPILTDMTSIASANSVAEIAALIGDPARANILSALMDGRALTAGELAWHARVTAQTASGHLAKLTEARLLAVEKQGRHRYYRLASAEVAQALESLMALAAVAPARHRPAGPRDEALRAARTCYDHIAGRLGTALSESLARRGEIVLAEGATTVTPAGIATLRAFGIELEGGKRSGRPLCRTCLDWSERRPHLAGRLGAALFRQSLELGWVERVRDSRALTVTPTGRVGFESRFGVTIP